MFYRLSHSDHESVTGTCVYLKIFEKQISEWMNIFFQLKPMQFLLGPKSYYSAYKMYVHYEYCQKEPTFRRTYTLYFRLFTLIRLYNSWIYSAVLLIHKMCDIWYMISNRLYAFEIDNFFV